MKGNCLIAQSGGPTAVINASAYGVIRRFLPEDCEIYAGIYGVFGIMDEKMQNIRKIPKQTLDYLKYMPSAAFGSCRYKLSDNLESDDNDYSKLLTIFKKFDIRYFFYIGGNDSMDSANKIHNYAKSKGYELYVFGVPKTVDNDLVITDHCPGYGSAAKYIFNVTAEAYCDMMSYHKPGVVIIEAMGRDTGWLTAAASLVANHVNGLNQLIYLPELAFDEDRFKADVEKKCKENDRLLIVASEGLKYADGSYIFANKSSDSFGHSKLGGVAKKLESIVKSTVNTSVRAIELSIIQRAATHSVSATDLTEAELLGYQAADMTLAGESGYMAALKRGAGREYSCSVEKAPLSEVCNAVKYFPKEWITKDGGIAEEFSEYALPLISGNVTPLFETGVIPYVDLNAFRNGY